MPTSIMLLPDGAIRVNAPAKLNLGLRVFPARGDGFHDLESWFVPLSWHDTLTFSPGDSLEFTIGGRTENVPAEVGKNLVTRAAMLLAERAGVAARVRIHLHKILPPGGGLGGGSSDAAHTLLALNRLWKLDLALEELHPLAAQLGSDVPFFLRSEPSLCTGRGEIITPLPARHPLFAVLILPNRGCSTKEIFQAFDVLHPAGSGPAEKTDWDELATLAAEELNGRIQNDLAPPAYQTAPWLAELQEKAEQIAGQRIHMTGSGSTLFTLCGSSQQTTAVRCRIEKALDSATTLITTEILR